MVMSSDVRWSHSVVDQAGRVSGDMGPSWASGQGTQVAEAKMKSHLLADVFPIWRTRATGPKNVDWRMHGSASARQGETETGKKVAGDTQVAGISC